MQLCANVPDGGRDAESWGRHHFLIRTFLKAKIICCKVHGTNLCNFLCTIQNEKHATDIN